MSVQVVIHWYKDKKKSSLCKSQRYVVAKNVHLILALISQKGWLRTIHSLQGLSGTAGHWTVLYSSRSPTKSRILSDTSNHKLFLPQSQALLHVILKSKFKKRSGFLHISVRKWKLWLFLARHFMKLRSSVRIMFIEDVMTAGQN